ncbi:hypothetical protein HBA54_04280 [Pelagibius litoralis]|uniref:Uncharacterized protein n=1 Tax=Pelagibius litoralis TaxID=374515 RepID=A0A967C3U2_9PROT|nr:hypothetical protein [Pelagibius litoralis]NIA67800.1 hypothetical protein [Pelagibius litoralis]
MSENDKWFTRGQFCLSVGVVCGFGGAVYPLVVIGGNIWGQVALVAIAGLGLFLGCLCHRRVRY